MTFDRTRQKTKAGKTKAAAALLAVAAFVSSCAGQTGLLDSEAGESAVIGTLSGPASGAGGAPAAGAPFPGPVPGSLAGGLVESYLDAQAEQLGAIPGAEIGRRDDSVLVSLQSSLLFESGEPTLLAEAYDRIRSLGRTLNNYPKSRVIIRAHTDSTGDDRFNQTLSSERADTVRKFLVTEGVAQDRITAIGFGEQMPMATNNTAEGRQQNRRVEIEIRPDEEIMSGR